MKANYLVVILLTALLVACGGGGGNPKVVYSPPTQQEIESVQLPTTPAKSPNPQEEPATPPQQQSSSSSSTAIPPPPTTSPPPPAPPTTRSMPPVPLTTKSTPPVPPTTKSTPPVPPTTKSTPPTPPTTKSTPPTPPTTTTQGEYDTWGTWASFSWEHFSVGGPISSDDGTAWTVQGTPTGSIDNLPRDANPLTDNVKYTGPVWGRVYDGFTRTPTGQHFDDGERVRGEMSVTYRPLSATRSMSVLLYGLRKEYPSVDPTQGQNYAPLPDMKYIGNISETATFSLDAEGLEDRYGRESGEATGSFFGPNGEAVAGTFWYRRNGHRVVGAFGGELEEH